VVFASHVLERARGKALRRGWHRRRCWAPHWLEWACERRWGQGVFAVVIRRRVILVGVPVPAGGGDEGRGVVVVVIRWRGRPRWRSRWPCRARIRGARRGCCPWGSFTCLVGGVGRCAYAVFVALAALAVLADLGDMAVVL